MMGFADMQWKVVPVDPSQGRQRGGLAIRLKHEVKKSGAHVGVGYLSAALRLRLHIGETIELLVNGRDIAVRPAEKDAQHPRRVTKTTGMFTATTLVCELLKLAPGESVTVLVTIEDGHAWGMLPDELVGRMRGGAA